MAVYVDDCHLPYGRMLMSHMMADTTHELLSMADAIGVDRRHIQKPGTPDEHFDICQAKRQQAIARGAKRVTKWQLVELRKRKRAIERHKEKIRRGVSP